jgi:hypothetical protein
MRLIGGTGMHQINHEAPINHVSRWRLVNLCAKRFRGNVGVIGAGAGGAVPGQGE